jgi:O-antigen/teichoic acid export membrane protein
MRTKTWFHVALYMGFTALSSMLGLASAVLLTHLLIPAEYGRLGLFLSALYIVAPLVSVSAEGLIAVNKMTLSSDAYEHFQRTAVGMSLLACLVAEVVLAAGLVAGLVPDALLLATPIFALIRFWATMASTEYVAEQRAMAYGMLTVLNGLASLALTYVLIGLLAPTAPFRILALLGADAMLLLIRYRGRLRILVSPKLNPHYRGQIWAFGLPAMVGLLGAWGMNEADKVIVARQIDLSTAGLYTAAATLAGVMLSFYQAVTNALFPNLYRQLAEDPSRSRALAIQSVGKFLLMATAFAALLSLAYSLFATRLLPARYSEASGYFYALVTALLAVSLYRPLGLFIDYFRMARIRAVAVTAGGLTSIVVAWFGIGHFGSAVWAAVGIGSGYAVAALILFLALLRYSPVEDIPA